MLPVDHGRTADPHGPSLAATVEAVFLEAYPDDEIRLDADSTLSETRYGPRESVEPAFVAALRHLPANQRAVLILREVLGFSAREVAESLGTTTSSVNSALQRARRRVAERLPEQSRQATPRALGDERLREIVARYMTALEHGDIDAVVAMPTEDATWSEAPGAGLVPRPRGDRRLSRRRAVHGSAGATFPPARAARRRSAATPGTRRREDAWPRCSTCSPCAARGSSCRASARRWSSGSTCRSA